MNWYLLPNQQIRISICDGFVDVVNSSNGGIEFKLDMRKYRVRERQATKRTKKEEK